MKTNALLWMLVVSATTQAQQWQWGHNLNKHSSGWNHSAPIVMAGTGGEAYTSGFTTVNGVSGTTLVKHSSSGNVIWQKLYDTLSVSDLAVDSKNNLYVTGNVHNHWHFSDTTITWDGNSKGYLMSLNANGKRRWIKFIKFTGFQANSLSIDAQDNITVLQYADAPYPNHQKAFRFSRFSTAGTLQWETEYVMSSSWGGAQYTDVYLHGLRTDNNGIIYAWGSYSGSYFWINGQLKSSLGNAGFMLQLNNVGQLAAIELFQGYPLDLGFDYNNNMYMYGSFDQHLVLGGDTVQRNPICYRPYSCHEYFLAVRDPAGNYLTKRAIPGYFTSGFHAFTVSRNGDIYFQGHAFKDYSIDNIFIPKTGGFFILKFNSQLQAQWMNRPVLTGTDVCQEGVMSYSDVDAGLYVSGNYSGNVHLGQTNLVNTVDGNQNFVSRISDGQRVGLSKEEIHDGVLLYPNPGNGQFSLEIPEPATANIFDIRGQLVASRQCMAGKTALELNLAPDIYFVQVQGEKITANWKLVIR